MSGIDFGLVLNLHQPAGNLDDLLEMNEWEAKEILGALDRIPRARWDDEDVGRVHLALSGTLLEKLADLSFQERAYGIVDCGSLLWHLQNTRTIEILGSAAPTTTRCCRSSRRPTVTRRSRAGWASAGTCSGATDSRASGRPSGRGRGTVLDRCALARPIGTPRTRRHGAGAHRGGRVRRRRGPLRRPAW